MRKLVHIFAIFSLLTSCTLVSCSLGQEAPAHIDPNYDPLERSLFSRISVEYPKTFSSDFMTDDEGSLVLPKPAAATNR